MITGATSGTFQNLQLGVGAFISEAYTGTFDKSKVIGATRGGASISIVPVMRSIAVDGIPDNTKEARVIDNFTATATFTAIEVGNKDILVRALAGADYSASTKKITLRHKLADGDFKDIYWLGETSKGDMIQITFKNSLSTGGMSLQANDKGEGEVAITIEANYSVADLDTPPVEIQYISPQQ